MDPLEDGFLERYQRDEQEDLSNLSNLSISNPLHPLRLGPLLIQISEPHRVPNSTFLRTFMSRSTLIRITSPIGPQPCHLANLPKETFDVILGHLPPSSASSLALTCKGFLAAVGNGPFEALSRDRYETYVLLWSIEKDLPEQSVCHSCNRLHNTETALRYYRDGRNGCGESQKRHKALKCRLDTRLDWDYKELLDEDFSPRIFNMAMKHSLHYPDRREFLNALSGECTAKGDWHAWIKESQTDCRILRGSLIHRTQMVWITPINDRMPFALTMEQCAHTRVGCHKNGLVYTRSYGLSCDDDDEDSQCLSCDWDSPEVTLDLLKCRRCSTQCELTMKPLPMKESGMALYITRWVDLGSGTLDEKWQRYFHRGRFEFEYQEQTDSVSLSSAFENDGGFRNKIEDQRYASLFHSPVAENGETLVLNRMNDYLTYFMYFDRSIERT
ncbi:uncharacterized protein EAF01_005837 [Botrytis porri]|uniref:uncharacterized protein n=1 Tax=Botrytis porri TaxID=87229 RepID=UPI001900B30D|nr:uncharacterized protein EAF01_005837 [Botrytis porri]KAF7905316.1 hypothetical protein EAF01_005837 [Botrytis porri]